MPTNRRSEAIWIESNEHWRIKVQKNGVRKSFYSSIKGRKGKHEAEAKADDWLASNQDDIPFKKAWELFIEDQKRRTRAGNWKKHVQYYDNYIKPNVGARKLSSITPVIWQSCINAAAFKGLSRRTCINIRATITCFIRYALRARWSVQRLEDGDLIIPNQAAPIKEKRVLQPDSIRLLFDDPRIVRYKKKVIAQYSYAWQFFVVTGLRRGELCGLRVEDLTGNILTIKRSINDDLEETSGKNDNARRTIELSQIAMQILEKQREMLNSGHIVSPWIFPDKNGERSNPNHIYDQWQTWCAQNGLKLSLHEIRHTFVSVNKSDLPVELMKATVGHSSSMDTYGVYGHQIDGEMHRAASIVDSVFSELLSVNHQPPASP